MGGHSGNSRTSGRSAKDLTEQQRAPPPPVTLLRRAPGLFGAPPHSSRPLPLSSLPPTYFGAMVAGTPSHLIHNASAQCSGILNGPLMEPPPPPSALHDFPIVKNGQSVLIEGQFEAQISTLRRPPALYIRVKKLQTSPTDVPLSSLLFLDVKDKEIRSTVRNLTDQLLSWKPTGQKGDRHPPNKDSLPLLEQHHVKRLEKESESFPDAVYYCQLCDHHISSISHAKAHFEMSHHLDDEKRMEQREKLVEFLPHLFENHRMALKNVFEKVRNGVPMEPGGSCSRLKSISTWLEKELQCGIASHCNIEKDDITIALYGSVRVGSDDSHSDINFMVDIPDCDVSDAMGRMQEIHAMFSSYDNLKKLTSDVVYHEGGFPHITFLIEKVYRVRLTWRNYENVKTSVLLSRYTENQPTIQDLMRLVRQWARCACLDTADRARPGLARYGFDLMVIHFMQKMNWLPIREEAAVQPLSSPSISGASSIDGDDRSGDSLRGNADYASSNSNQDKLCFDGDGAPSLPDVFVEFLRYYTKEHFEVVQIMSRNPVMKDETKWSKKSFQIKDPFRSDNVVTFSKSFQCYFFNCFLVSFCYFIVPRNASGPVVNVELFQQMGESPRKKKNRKQTTAEVAKTPTPTDQKQNGAVRKLDTSLQQKEDVAESETDDSETNTARMTRMMAAMRLEDGISRNKPATTTNPVLGFKELDEQLARRQAEEKAAAALKKNPGSRLVAGGQSETESADSHSVSSKSQKRRKNRKRKKAKEAAVNTTLEETVDTNQEEKERLRKLVATLKFDGKLIHDLKPEDFEIDDWYTYSRRTMFRLRRVCDTPFPNEMLTQIEQLGVDRFETPSIFENMPVLESSSSACDVMESDVCETTALINCVSIMEEEVSTDAHEMVLPSCEVSSCVNGEKEDIVLPPDVSIFSDMNGYKVDAQGGSDSGRVTVSTPASVSHDYSNETDEAPVASKDGSVGGENRVTSPESEFSEQVTKADGDRSTAKAKEENNATDSPQEKICFEEFYIKLEGTGVSPKDYFKAQTADWSPDIYEYMFDGENFTLGYKAELKCGSCEKTDHCTEQCPLMQIPKVEDFHCVRNDHEMKELSNIILESYDKSCVTEQRLDEVNDFIVRMQKHLQKELGRDSRLDVFGSLYNGFGVNSSDVDICFRFASDTPPPDREAISVIRKISNKLHRCDMRIYDIQTILSAKVPIVKFQCQRPDLEGDISYYNVLALTNTMLLSTYCKWAPDRLPQLGLWIKRWAKHCDIGDASKGSLSSYSYIVMLIHYLQNCEPAVLPRLQEDFRTEEDEPILVDNWDVYFHTVVDENWSKNTQTVSELFIGFLDYYSKFDFSSKVIQIRRKKPLTKMEKEWRKPMCLEDPFDRNHNLGSGLSSRMYVHIVRTFINARKVFMTPAVREKYVSERRIAADEHMTIAYLPGYADKLLTASTLGSAPCDRQCRYCHRVGHFAESCPARLNAAKRREMDAYRMNNGYGRNGGDGGGNRGQYYKQKYGGGSRTQRWQESPGSGYGDVNGSPNQRERDFRRGNRTFSRGQGGRGRGRSRGGQDHSLLD